MGYNGWKNKETWLVNLWLGDSLAMDQESGFEITADYIEQLVDDMVCESMASPNGFVADLLSCALCEIDYDELAEHYEEESEDA
jgi:hypothetical protein